MQGTGGWRVYFFSCFCCWYLLKWLWMVRAAFSDGSLKNLLSLLASGATSPGRTSEQHSEHRQALASPPLPAGSGQPPWAHPRLPADGKGGRGLRSAAEVKAAGEPAAWNHDCPGSQGACPGRRAMERGTGGTARRSLPGSAKPSIYTASLPKDLSFPTFNHHV